LGALLILLLISAVVILYIRKLPFLFCGLVWYLGTAGSGYRAGSGGQAGSCRQVYLSAVDWYWDYPGLGHYEFIAKGETAKDNINTVSSHSNHSDDSLTWQQCGYWKNSITLFNHALQVTKNNYLAHDSLGVAAGR